VIEQAKGVIAERLGLHVDEAFDLMRGYARSQNEKLSEVAERVVSRQLDLSAPRRSRSPRA
jgi:AmiR/NasT family two-component response regulator